MKWKPLLFQVNILVWRIHCIFYPETASFRREMTIFRSLSFHVRSSHPTDLSLLSRGVSFQYLFRLLKWASDSRNGIRRFAGVKDVRKTETRWINCSCPFRKSVSHPTDNRHTRQIIFTFTSLSTIWNRFEGASKCELYVSIKMPTRNKEYGDATHHASTRTKKKTWIFFYVRRHTRQTVLKKYTT